MTTHESLDRDTPATPSSERSFGIVFCVVFVLIGLYPLLGGAPPRWWSLAVAGGFLALALAAPRVLRPANRLWLKFGELLHYITNPIILGVMFFVVIMPIGLVLRLFGKDLLRRRFDAKSESYWIPRQPPGPERDSLTRQF